MTRPGVVALSLALVTAGCRPGSPSAAATPRPTATPVETASPVPAAPSLTRLTMVSASVGWAMAAPAVTANPFPGSRTGVVRTIDGGAHWTVVLPAATVQPALSGPAITEAADFADSTHAWALELLDGESTASVQTLIVASTSDGGAHWTATPRFGVSGAATHVQFVDATHGWVFATPSAGGVIGSQDTTLDRTVDGGSTWQVIKPASQVRQAPGVLGTLPEACPMGGPIGAPSFIDAQTGWVGAFCDRMFFFVTHDGGLTWAAQGLPPFPGPPSSGPSALLYATDPPLVLSASDVVAFAHRGLTTGANALQEAAIYVTHDAGASWSASRLPAPELGADFIDPRDGWMVAAGPGGDIEARSLYSTVDGGGSWRLVSGPQDYFERELSFVSRTDGFIAAPAVKGQPGRLLKTADGGATWVPIPASID